MSLEAMVWALKKAPVDDQAALLVLIGLADHAHDDGTASFPSVTTLATYARCSRRTVYNRLRELEAAGLIRRGDQSLVAHRRADRRPVVYDLNLNAVRVVHPEDGVHAVHPVAGDGMHPVHPVDGDGVHGGTERGAQPGIHGVHAVAHKPSSNHPEPPTHSSPHATTASDADSFDAFWASYPKQRRTGKAQARKAFAKAVTKVGADRIIAGARRFADDPNLPEAQFIPHPATWLNQERWDDPPLPPRVGGRPNTAARVNTALDVARRMAEADGLNLPAIGGQA